MPDEGDVHMRGYFGEPTGAAKERHDEWLKGLSNASHQQLVEWARARYDHLSPHIIVIPSDDKWVGEICTIEQGYLPPIVRLKRVVEVWLFEHDKPYLFHENCPILDWPEEPENSVTSFLVHVLDFRSDTDAVHFRMRW
jgi:hypothetical protein